MHSDIADADAINVKTSALTLATNTVVKFLKYTFKNQPSPSNISKRKQFGLQFRSPFSPYESSPQKMSAQQKSVSLSNRDTLASIPNPAPPSVGSGGGSSGDSMCITEEDKNNDNSKISDSSKSAKEEPKSEPNELIPSKIPAQRLSLSLSLSNQPTKQIKT